MTVPTGTRLAPSVPMPSRAAGPSSIRGSGGGGGGGGEEQQQQRHQRPVKEKLFCHDGPVVRVSGLPHERRRMEAAPDDTDDGRHRMAPSRDEGQREGGSRPRRDEPHGTRGDTGPRGSWEDRRGTPPQDARERRADRWEERGQREGRSLPPAGGRGSSAESDTRQSGRDRRDRGGETPLGDARQRETMGEEGPASRGGWGGGSPSSRPTRDGGEGRGDESRDRPPPGRAPPPVDSGTIRAKGKAATAVAEAAPPTQRNKDGFVIKVNKRTPAESAFRWEGGA